MVSFVEDISAASAWYSRLLEIESIDTGSFIKVGTLGFHPADERSIADTSVAYSEVDDVSSAIERGHQHGFTLHRGPLERTDIVIAQVKDGSGLAVGMISTHGSNE